MKFSRKRRQQPGDDLPPGYNPGRDEHLFWLTREGYVIAQDVACQHEYMQEVVCGDCGGALIVLAQLNRGGQGLIEWVAVCSVCQARASVIFDISNDAYQAWWAEQLGSLYVKQFDGPPREPYEPYPD